MDLNRGAWPRRINRRTILKGTGVAGAGVSAFTLFGCNQEKAPGTSEIATVAQHQPKRGGILRDPRYDVLTGRTNDPHKESATSNKMRRIWYQGLLGYNAKTIEVEPELAQKWEQPSEREFIFTLQPGVKWHNKAPANGRDM